MSENHAPDQVRRKLLVGAAWSAPVILLATAAPASAASTQPTNFDSTITISTAGTAGARGNVTISAGSLLLTGNEGDSTGEIFVTARAPIGYTTDLVDGTQLGEWTVSVTGEPPVVEFFHPGATLATDGSLAINFPGLVFTGTGATASNNASVNVFSSIFGDIVTAVSPGSRG